MKATLFCSLLFLLCKLRQSDKLNVCIRASPRGSSHFNTIDGLPDDETKTYGDSVTHAGWESSILRMKPLHRLGDYPAFLDVRAQPIFVLTHELTHHPFTPSSSSGYHPLRIILTTMNFGRRWP